MLISALIIDISFNFKKVIKICISVNCFYCNFKLLKIMSDLSLFYKKQLLQSVITAVLILSV